MELFKDSHQKNKAKKRVGRGGKRGTTAGRGTKGQKSRAGHRIRPAERDLLIRLPKLRGSSGNRSIQEKLGILNLSDLARLPESTFTKKNLGKIKILGQGSIDKSIIIEGLAVSKNAREKIKKAGGAVK